MWKDFFYYSKSERRVILFLLALLMVTGGGLWVWRYAYPPVQVHSESCVEIDSFLAGVKKREAAYAVRSKRKSESRPVVLFDFDPNTADSVELRSLGLPAFVVRNILHYREKGGVFRTSDAFAKIYGLKKEQFLQLKPYIQIAPRETAKQDSVRLNTSVQKNAGWVEKYASGTVVSLNEADTSQLKRVPGIGSGLAKMIVAYRDKLGGFTHLEQLQEIPHVDTCLNKWFVVKGVPFRMIRVNKDGLEKLRNHPYMDFYKARAILEYRRKRGKIKGLSRLSLFEEFTEKDLRRLTPYLSFE